MLTRFSQPTHCALFVHFVLLEIHNGKNKEFLFIRTVVLSLLVCLCVYFWYIFVPLLTGSGAATEDVFGPAEGSDVSR